MKATAEERCLVSLFGRTTILLRPNIAGELLGGIKSQSVVTDVFSGYEMGSDEHCSRPCQGPSEAHADTPVAILAYSHCEWGYWHKQSTTKSGAVEAYYYC